jgi:hypothetical protein
MDTQTIVCQSQSMTVINEETNQDRKSTKRTIIRLVRNTISITKVVTFTLALLISQFVYSQSAWVPCALQVFPDGPGGSQITWDITWNGDTIAKGGPYPNTVELSYTDHFYLPPACFTLSVHDTGCNGFGGNWGSGGSLSLYRTDQMIIIGNLAYNYGCLYQHEFCLGTGYTAPCENNCPSDINGDGIVNVSDLNMMLSDWGQACPQ